MQVPKQRPQGRRANPMSMLPDRRLIPILALLAGTAAVPAQSLQLKQLLPADTIFFASTPDLTASFERFHSMPLARMWREREVQDFFADLLAYARNMYDENLAKARDAHEQGMLPFKPDDLLQLRLRGGGVALTRLGIGMGPMGPVPELGLVLHADFGQSAPTWRALIDHALTQAENESGGELTVNRGQFEAGGRKFETISAGNPMVPLSLNLGWVGDNLLITATPEDLQGLLKIASGEAEGGLVQSANYQATWSRVKSESVEMEVYIQPGPMLDFAMEVVHLAAEMQPEFRQHVDPAGVERALDALGLRSIRASGFVWSYENGSGVTRSYTYSPAGERKGLFAGTTKVLDPKILRYVHKSASSLSASTFDIAALWDGLWGAVEAYDPKLAQMLQAELGRHEEALGVKLREDLVASLGNSYAWWSMPVAAIMQTPPMYLLMEVKDPERLTRALKALATLTQGVVEIADVERRGMKMLHVRLTPPAGMLGNTPFDIGTMFSPYLAFRDGYMLAALSTSDMKRLSERLGREDDPSDDIRSSAEFARYAETMPTEQIYELSFDDWKAQFEGMYQLFTSVAAFIPMDADVPIDLKLLPDVGTLTQHLAASVSWSRVDGNGWHTLSYSPWGPELIVLGGGALAAGATAIALMPRSVMRRFR